MLEIETFVVRYSRI